MKMLIVGAGVIGTVYGAHLAAAGNQVSVLRHGPGPMKWPREACAPATFSAAAGSKSKPSVVPDASGDYDVVLIAVRRDQLASAFAELAVLDGKPGVVFFGNNPSGRAAIPDDLPGDVYLGFPGVGGVMADGTAEYVRIRQQPTALPRHLIPGWQRWNRPCPAAGSPSSESPTWTGGSPATPRSSRASRRPCTAAEPILSASPRTARPSRSCAGPSPRHSPVYAVRAQAVSRATSPSCTACAQAVAVRYWARTMRSPMGELAFAAHSRHAETEMRALGDDMAARITGSPALTELLRPLERQP